MSTAIGREFRDIVREGVPLAGQTWLRVGGPAEILAEPRSLEELQALVVRCRQHEIPIRLLGGGSNVLVRDEGVRGVVVKLTQPAFLEVSIDRSRIRAGGGALLGNLVSAAVGAGLAGLENLVGIPGTVGGALHGNAGSHGTDVGQWTCRSTVLTRSGEIHIREREDLVFAYRQSSLNELAILGAEWELEQGDPKQLTKRMQKQWIVKKAAQPMSHQACGCIFRDARGMSAEALIEQAGLKAAQSGGAEISEQHPGFIVAHQGATSRDVLQLIELVRERVSEQLGVDLELAIEVW
jgi:UDP-N-acetylmuramate dehydrogenase